MIGLDRDDVVYICGLDRLHGPVCLAFQPGSKDPLWQVALGKGVTVNGGALVPGRLYMTKEEGFLLALEGAQAP